MSEFPAGSYVWVICDRNEEPYLIQVVEDPGIDATSYGLVWGRFCGETRGTIDAFYPNELRKLSPLEQLAMAAEKSGGAV